jgi:hypothetical protein
VSRSPLHHLAHPLLVLAGLATVVSVPFGLLGDFSDLSHAALARTTPFVADAGLECLGFLLFAVAIAGLADHRGPDGRGLGAWPVALGLVAAVTGFFTHAAQAFVQPAIGRAAPALLDDVPSGLLAVGVFGGMALTVAGLLTLAVSAYRTRVLPRPAAVLLGIGALGVVLGSVGALLLGAGLLWGGAAALGARRAVAGVRA